MNTEPIITFVCDMCQKIENYDDRFCYNGQDLCIDCYSRDEEPVENLCEICQEAPAVPDQICSIYCAECCGYCGNKCYKDGVWHCEEYIKDQERCGYCGKRHTHKDGVWHCEEYIKDEEEKENDRLYGDNPCYQHYKAGQYDCDICRIIKCDKCQMSLKETNAINGLCQFCYVPEKVSNPIADCLTFIIDRIVDEETNAIKENECPVCMEQINITRCDLIITGDNCDHRHCEDCLWALEQSSNRCSICRSVLCDDYEDEEEMPDLTSDDEEDRPCQDCGRLHSPIWGPADVLQGIWCDDCYNSRIFNLEQAEAAAAEEAERRLCNFCNAIDGRWRADVYWWLCDNCYDTADIQDADEQPHLCEICQAPGATIRPERPDSEWLCDNCEDGH